MTFLYLKAVHIVFIVTWFAGLFYIPRLLVYIIEAGLKDEPARSILRKQLKLMVSRLWYGITWPSAIVTLGMGIALLVNQPEYLQLPFMHIKLTLVALLYGYHLSLHYLIGKLSRDVAPFTSQQLRLWNEVATLLLVSIVFIIVLKNALSILWGLAGLVLLTLMIVVGIRVYRKLRNND
jgi:protoporphyrinogen IX oxidase